MNTGELEGRQTFVEERLLSQWLIEQMPEAIWATDAALRFVAAGGAAARSLGLEADRTVGTSVYEYFQTTDPSFPPLAAHLRALQGETVRYDFTRGGRAYLVRVAPVRHIIGRVVGVVGCATDITDAATAARRESEHAAPQNLPPAAVRLDGELRVTFANAEALQVLGPAVTEGAVLNEVAEVPGALVEAARGALRLYAEPDSTAVWTVRMLCAGGSVPWIEFGGTNRILDPAVGGLVLTLRDVSVEHRAQQTLLRRAADLEAAQEFAATLLQARTLRDVQVLVTAQVVNLMASDHAALALVDPEGESFTLAHVQGPLGSLSGTSFPMTGLYAQVIESGQPLQTNSPHDDPAFPEDCGLTSTIIVPMRGAGTVRGALCVARRTESPDGPFGDADLRRLEALARLAGDALAQAVVTANLEQAYVEAVLALARAMDAHDALGPGHGSAVAHWAEAIARRMDCRDEDVRDIRWAALLHNVGKIGIPEEIVRKTGPLSAGEAALLRQYPVIGGEMLRPAPGLRNVATLVRHHQERWDGSGYPDGSRSEEIPLGSRIIAVADAYNAMTEHRRYKVARAHAEAVAELQRGAGSQFDPQVVRVFLELLAESRAV